MPMTDRCDGKSHGGAIETRPTRWADETAMTPHLQQFSGMAQGSDFVNGEQNIAAHRAMIEAVPLQYEKRLPQSRTRVRKLKTKKKNAQLITRRLYRDAKRSNRILCYDQLCVRSVHELSA